MQWLTALSVPLVVAVFWLYTVQVTRSTFPLLRRKRICLLIAHPDDEAMFFAPTLLALTAPDLGNHIKILCLSSGDADGLGETRKKELVKSGMLLGLRKEDDVLVIEDSNFPDSMTATWDAKQISNLLTKAFAPAMAQKPSSAAPNATIDVLVTFDRHGVSSHPNHISLYHGSRAFLSSLMKGRAGWECPVSLYTLTSTLVVRKYISILDSVTTLLHIFALRKKQWDPPTPLLFVSSPGQYRTAQKAMTKAHVSQMRWFRWGWIAFSRYMLINDLKLEKP